MAAVVGALTAAVGETTGARVGAEAGAAWVGAAVDAVVGAGPQALSSHVRTIKNETISRDLASMVLLKLNFVRFSAERAQLTGICHVVAAQCANCALKFRTFNCVHQLCDQAVA